jgi:hypothetical protein
MARGSVIAAVVVTVAPPVALRSAPFQRHLPAPAVVGMSVPMLSRGAAAPMPLLLLLLFWTAKEN